MTAENQTIEIPDGFAKDTVTREGDAGQDWLEALPRRIEEMCRRWQLVMKGAVMHGYTSLAIPAQRGKENCILKVYWHNRDTECSHSALKVWNGRGAVKLLDEEPSLGAVLLERLDPVRSLERVEIGKAVIIAGKLLRRLAIPAPAHIRSVTLLAPEMIQFMQERWAEYGQPFPRHLLDQVCEGIARLGPLSGKLMTDYDLHYLDVLTGQREPWLMIDPKAIAGDPEFSLAQLLWTRLEDMVANRGLGYYFHSLVESAELNRELARTWAVIRCAHYWLWGLTVGLTHDPARCNIIIKQLGKP
jgi:streptomycin 6-kinase